MLEMLRGKERKQLNLLLGKKTKKCRVVFICRGSKHSLVPANKQYMVLQAIVLKGDKANDNNAFHHI
jgi:hypothetical protein